VFAAGPDDDITRLLRRAETVSALLAGDDAQPASPTPRRNILRIESVRGPFTAG